MVGISSIRAANSSLRTLDPGLALTAVFIGGTSGIGLATLRAFAQHVPRPNATIVGRNRSRFEPHLASLQQLNPNGKFTFIEHPIELLADVDATSNLIQETLHGKKIDLFYQSQGYISFAGRQSNADGLDSSIALRYHGRVRFTHNLLPHLAPRARVVSILAGRQEGKIFEDDLGLERNYSVPNSMGHFASLMTLQYDGLAAGERSIEKAGPTFVHAFPGLVATGLLGNSATGLLGYLFRWVVDPLLALLVAAKPEDVGERMLFYGTDASFGEEGRRAGKAVTIDDKGELGENEMLRQYRAKGMGEVVGRWEKDVWHKLGLES